ncbi:MAG: FG-GAP repeat protein, partial [Planctomycetes bacterium]|nr:FG-GAP repeat protein [Planctomycetota bacterium]
MPDGTCDDALLESECLGQSGSWSGEGTVCQGTGACCLDPGDCAEVDGLCCGGLGGLAQGVGSVCQGDVNGNGVDDTCESAVCEPIRILASNESVDSDFGLSVGMDGDTIVVGARFDDTIARDGGAARVFVRDGVEWAQEVLLLPPGGSDDDFFGTSVSIDGTVIAVGSPRNDGAGFDRGAVYMFRQLGGAWELEQTLRPTDGVDRDRLGSAVAVSGDVMVVGVWRDAGVGSFSGSAYVFRFDGTAWLEEAELVGSDTVAGDEVGTSVDVDGDTLVIGAPQDDDRGNASGSAYVFRWNGTSWVEEQKLTASDAASLDKFGRSVAISGDVVVVGAPFDDDGGESAGSAYVFSRVGSVWSQTTKLVAGDADVGDLFGSSVDVLGSLLVVGAPDADDESSPGGRAYLFEDRGSGWQPLKRLVVADAAFGDGIGTSVALSVEAVMLGSPSGDGASADVGVVYDMEIAGADCNGNGWLDRCDVANGTSEDCDRNGVPDECDPTVDSDNDGVVDQCDLCPGFDDAIDADGDGVPDACDACPGADDNADCDGDGTPDACQIADFTGGLGCADCDQNGILDVCDLASGSVPDCNNNDLPDQCDIESGASDDINGNGIPDECDPGISTPLPAPAPYDVAKTRYISFSTDSNPLPKGFQITLPDGRQGWVGEPVLKEFQGIDASLVSIVVATPVIRVWEPQVYHVTGCVIV